MEPFNSEQNKIDKKTEIKMKNIFINLANICFSYPIFDRFSMFD
jgi:hypothetical protein